MSLVPSLLQAIVQLDGDALVMHVGEKPYVVSPTGQVDLASRGLLVDAVVGIVNQLLPPAALRALEEFGAAQHDLPFLPDFPDERFAVVVARGGDDVWAEIRRRRVGDDDRIPLALFNAPPAPSPEMEPAVSEPESLPNPGALEISEIEALWRDDADSSSGVAEASLVESPRRVAIEEGPAELEHLSGREPEPDRTDAGPATAETVRAAVADSTVRDEDGPAAAYEEESSASEPTPSVDERPPSFDEYAQSANERLLSIGDQVPFIDEPVPSVDHQLLSDHDEQAPSADEQVLPGDEHAVSIDDQVPSVDEQVLSIDDRVPFIDEQTPSAYEEVPFVSDVRSVDEQAPLTIDHLLRLAAARGASALYLSSDSRPSMRVDGEIQPLDEGPRLGRDDVESLMLSLLPERSAEALTTGLLSEWTSDLPDFGRVRCTSFHDHRGPGCVLRMARGAAAMSDTRGFSRQMYTLAAEPDGLVLVAGPRLSGKRTLMSALVDLMNRTRRAHIITIESEVEVQYDAHGSFVSQREARGGSDEMLRAAKAALREDPDILVIEDVGTAPMIDLALEAAGSGRLVLCGLLAHDAVEAIDRIVDLHPPEHRAQLQRSLAQSLRGVVAQVLVRAKTGGRIFARELLINTPAVASLLTAGKTSQLPRAMAGGRNHGMAALNDALLELVRSGAVDVREAYRHSSDREAFLTALARQGVDLSTVEQP